MTRQKKPEMIMDNIEIDICRESPLWADRFPGYGDYISACLEQIIYHVPAARNFTRIPALELSIVVGDDDYIRELNRAYRAKDAATNVLSFPSLSGDDIEKFFITAAIVPDFPVLLGDIVFGFETIDREARDQDKKFADHFCHLCLHGMLHLLGYDHIDAAGRHQMEQLEKQLLSKLSIDDPYQD